MAKKMAILLNSPYLGGAERSTVEQVRRLEGHEITFFVPLLYGKRSEARSLLNFINKKNEFQIKYYDFPISLFSFSRSGKLMNIFSGAMGACELYLTLRSIELEVYDCIWANGNKVALVSYLYCYLKNYQGTFLWHFRDFPSLHPVYKQIWNCFKIKKNFHLHPMANSRTVSMSVESLTGLKTFVLYNPVDLQEDIQLDYSKRIEKIAFVSMMAPWKGVHQFITWASFYETELMKLGVKEVNIYGSSLYQTKGAHDSYFNQIKYLSVKLKSQLINFKGIQPPEVIFRQNDLLVHASVEAEPFGRVIAEAFANKVLVVTTGLGGAGELVEHNLTGLVFPKYDYGELYCQVERLLNDAQLRNQLRDNAYAKMKIIDNWVRNSLKLMIK